MLTSLTCSRAYSNSHTHTSSGSCSYMITHTHSLLVFALTMHSSAHTHTHSPSRACTPTHTYRFDIAHSAFQSCNQSLALSPTLRFFFFNFSFFSPALPFPRVKPFVPCAAHFFLPQRSGCGLYCTGRGDSPGKPETGCFVHSPAVGSPCCCLLVEAPQPRDQNPEALSVVKNKVQSKFFGIAL